MDLEETAMSMSISNGGLFPSSLSYMDLSEGHSEWSNIPSIVRSSIRTLMDVVTRQNELVQRQSSSIRKLMKEMENVSKFKSYFEGMDIKQDIIAARGEIENVKKTLQQKADSSHVNECLLGKANRSEILIIQENVKNNIVNPIANEINKKIENMNENNQKITKQQKMISKEMHAHERQIMSLLSSSDTGFDSKMTTIDRMFEDDDNVNQEGGDSSSASSFEVMKIKSLMKKLAHMVNDKICRKEFEEALELKANKESVAAALKKKISKNKLEECFEPLVIPLTANFKSQITSLSNTISDSQKENKDMSNNFNEQFKQLQFLLNEKTVSLTEENKRNTIHVSEVASSLDNKIFTLKRELDSVAEALQKTKESTASQTNMDDLVKNLNEVKVRLNSLSNDFGHLQDNMDVESKLNSLKSEVETILSAQLDKITEKISKDRKEDSEQSAKAVSAIQSQDVFINETLRKFHTSILAKDKELNDLKIFFISEIKKVQDSSNTVELEKTLTKKMSELANASSVRDALEAMQLGFEKVLGKKMDKKDSNNTDGMIRAADEENISRLLKKNLESCKETVTSTLFETQHKISALEKQISDLRSAQKESDANMTVFQKSLGLFHQLHIQNSDKVDKLEKMEPKSNQVSSSEVSKTHHHHHHHSKPTQGDVKNDEKSEQKLKHDIDSEKLFTEIKNMHRFGHNSATTKSNYEIPSLTTQKSTIPEISPESVAKELELINQRENLIRNIELTNKRNIIKESSPYRDVNHSPVSTKSEIDLGAAINIVPKSPKEIYRTLNESRTTELSEPNLSESIRDFDFINTKKSSFLNLDNNEIDSSLPPMRKITFDNDEKSKIIDKISNIPIIISGGSENKMMHFESYEKSEIEMDEINNNLSSNKDPLTFPEFNVSNIAPFETPLSKISLEEIASLPVSLKSNSLDDKALNVDISPSVRSERLRTSSSGSFDVNITTSTATSKLPPTRRGSVASISTVNLSEKDKKKKLREKLRAVNVFTKTSDALLEEKARKVEALKAEKAKIESVIIQKVYEDES